MGSIQCRRRRLHLRVPESSHANRLRIQPPTRNRYPRPLGTTPDLVSAGFDAAAGDPLGGCEVSPAGYAHMTHMLMPLAEGKIVLVLEGGYSLDSTSKSALACVRVLMGEPPGQLDS